MNYISVENLTKSYGDKLLFNSISFGLDKGEKVALIAQNGTGKSTLLNIIMGIDTVDEGKVTIRNNIHIAYLPQNNEMYEDHTILDVILNANTPLIQTVKTYEKALKAYSVDANAANKKNIEDIMAQMDIADAWNFENRVKEILSKFKIEDIFLNFNSLSGGERKKVALAQTLLSDSEILLLDEPTNHLDIEMIEWLEDYLSTTNMTLLFVTHDRFFLDNICTDILELDGGQLYRYKGKYNYFLEKKTERIANQLSEIESAKSIYRRELDWIKATPQARTTKAKARIQRFEEIKEKINQTTQQPSSDFAVIPERIGKKILEINNLDFKYDKNWIIRDFSYVFKRGERCGIVGKNGAGKTTFLKLVMNELKPTAGRIVAGETIVFGYYGQEGLSQSYHGKRLIDIVKEQAEMIRVENGNYISASQFLNHFGFSFQTQYSYYEDLSGGQKRKFYLLLVLMKNPNFLILDEPTNDFDIDTLNVLENFLSLFKGCLLIVSHDRWFMNKLVDHLFIFEENGKIKDFYGNYADYKKQKLLKEKRIRTNKKNEKQKKEKLTNKTITLTYKEVKELEQLEVEIETLENEKNTITEKMSHPIGNAKEIEEIYKQYTSLSKELDEKFERWLALSEKQQ